VADDLQKTVSKLAAVDFGCKLMHFPYQLQEDLLTLEERTHLVEPQTADKQELEKDLSD